MSADGVIIDTSLWIEYFKGSAPNASFVERLVLEERAVTTGAVLAELLQGVRSEREGQTIAEVFGGLPTLEITTEIWKAAGQLACALRRQGVTVPLTDVALGALALGHHLLVFSLDKHFEQIPGVRLYHTPPSAKRERR
ncbi:MAG: PIN domain-containing protein [candidate division NC10 bacterium]|nr:PIN domain-containing protein [candidate division NC10 bacterium]MDE2322938.1 PIN domain-containing protein [candidate division NC10 bacterium]